MSNNEKQNNLPSDEVTRKVKKEISPKKDDSKEVTTEISPEIKKKKENRGCSCILKTFFLSGFILTIIALILFLIGLKMSAEFAPLEETSKEIVVLIPPNSNVSEIGQILKDNKVIRSKRAFVWAFKIQNKIIEIKNKVSSTSKRNQYPLKAGEKVSSTSKRNQYPLKAGEMALDPSLSVWKNMELISKGNYKLYPFTVPEGWTLNDIALALENQNLGSKKQFLELGQNKTFINSLGLETNSLEGYLFPDTYNFPKDTSQEQIIKTMVNRFFSIWKKYEQSSQERGLTRHQIITLASIIEKETGAPEERPLIAGVFNNRLEKGMRLETDPTVVYGLKDFAGKITKKHLTTPHPYNTYVISGLPPGPIANPGELAISAAINPAKVDYLFFVSKNDGTHHFSNTLTEHNRMVDKYQRNRSE